MSLEVLPLAITMMAGPQIMAAIIFVTAPRAVRVSLAFLAGVAVATTLGVAAARGLAALLGDSASLGDPSERGSVGSIIQAALVALLLLAAVRCYLQRRTAEPPKWLGTLLVADPTRALVVGLLVILLMPSDVVVMLTVGINLAQHGSPLTEALPFIAATAVIAALPLLSFATFRRRAHSAMPRLRDWMNAHGWVVKIFVYGVFIALIVSGP
ncbi:MAG: GAP family protein [Carbonactinosporaceae bacterium]